MSEVSVRYIVTDLDAAIAFYTGHLDFAVEMRPAPTFAMLRRGDLRLLLSVPSGQGGGGQPLADGRRPAALGVVAPEATRQHDGHPRRELQEVRW